MFKNLVRKAAISLAYGLKGAESDMLKQKTTTSESNEIHQQKSSTELMQGLLKGEINQEVELLRDRMYYVSEESKKYKVSTGNIKVNSKGEIEFVGDIKVTKKNNFIDKPKVFEDEYKAFLAMETPLVTNGVLDTMNSVADKNILEKEESPLDIVYENYPKYKLQKFIEKVVLRKRENVNEDDIVLDFYVPIMYEKGDNISSMLISEINKSLDKQIKPINLEFETVAFITEDAYGSDDLCEYKLKMKFLSTIQKYKSNYILTYSVTPIIMGDKITEKYVKEDLRAGYKEKKRRNNKINLDFGSEFPSVV